MRSRLSCSAIRPIGKCRKHLVWIVDLNIRSPVAGAVRSVFAKDDFERGSAVLDLGCCQAASCVHTLAFVHRAGRAGRVIPAAFLFPGSTPLFTFFRKIVGGILDLLPLGQTHTVFIQIVLIAFVL